MGLKEEKERMLSLHLKGRDIKDEKILKAFEKIDRELFVPKSQIPHAYEDRPLPIGEGQTISQPYIVAFMLQLLDVEKHHKVLEIGTGSGYQTALLAELAKTVYTVEIKERLLEKAKKILSSLGYKNIHFKLGDGKKGWKEHSPYDRIIVSAAPQTIPEELINQLAPGGKMVIPAGSFFQNLYLIEKDSNGNVKKTKSLAVSFVPLV